jgi:hypothetical protein
VGKDIFIDKINALIDAVNRVAAINELGLKNTDFPDLKIASLHNHLGNIKHYLGGATVAFNASEQFMILKEAERELEEVQNDLYELHHGDVINSRTYANLLECVADVDELLRRATDPDFM